MNNNIAPVSENMILMGEKYCIREPANGKFGYRVCKLLSTGGQTYVGLQPFEKWRDPESIKKYYGESIQIFFDSLGQIRIHESNQKVVVEELKSLENNLQDSDELLATAVQKLFDQFTDLKSLTNQLLLNADEKKKSELEILGELNLLREEINKLRQVFKIWNNDWKVIGANARGDKDSPKNKKKGV